jgi:hypothetical protein
MAQIGEELLAFQWPAREAAFRQQVVRALMSGYHSHQYAITREEMAAMGLRMVRDIDAERLAWDISLLIQGHIGGALRAAPADPWHDALLATRAGVSTRSAQADGMAPQWREERFA